MKALTVALNGFEVGTLFRDGTGAMSFQYKDEWLLLDGARAMKLLLGSLQPTQDREMFFKSQILFWLLAAVDGHGKNFSIFIQPESAYKMTPLYDVLSAYPIFATKGIAPKKAKMAMALRGKNRQYNWAYI
ncbi:HipA domain-containing protein [Photorhabdus caribbeanensis]|uniref:HipA domain-containing protein n=1 Tax=Photorhabdus caribbeanensis TaxID=1004165 RepID=UPI001FEA13E4|nr:HipA domain-containing protein [Photorhabdus caribbeanensis]